MDTKRNTRFFKQTDLWRIVGAALAIVGLVWFYFGWSMASYYGPIVMIPVGTVLFIVCSARAVSESEIRQAVERAASGLGEDLKEGRAASLVKATFLAQGTYYEAPATMFRRGKDAKVLSDAVSATVLALTEEALLVRNRRILLCKEQNEDESLYLAWAELAEAGIEPFETRVKLTNTKNTYAGVRGAWLLLTATDGRAWRFPIQNDVDAERFVEDMLRYRAAADKGGETAKNGSSN